MICQCRQGDPAPRSAMGSSKRRPRCITAVLAVETRTGSKQAVRIRDQRLVGTGSSVFLREGGHARAERSDVQSLRRALRGSALITDSPPVEWPAPMEWRAAVECEPSRPEQRNPLRAMALAPHASDATDASDALAAPACKFIPGHTASQAHAWQRRPGFARAFKAGEPRTIRLCRRRAINEKRNVGQCTAARGKPHRHH